MSVVTSLMKPVKAIAEHTQLTTISKMSFSLAQRSIYLFLAHSLTRFIRDGTEALCRRD